MALPESSSAVHDELLRLLNISWLASSCLDAHNTQQELAALKSRPFLREVPKASSTTRLMSGGRRPPHQPVGNSPTRERPTFRRTRLTTNEIMLAFQDETEVLRQALEGDQTSYRVAQVSMDRMGELETALWESHKRESRELADLETEKLRLAQDAERAAMKQDFAQREDRLRASCIQQTERLRQDHEQKFKEQLGNSQQAQVRGHHHHRTTRHTHEAAIDVSSTSLQSLHRTESSKPPAQENRARRRQQERKDPALETAETRDRLMPEDFRRSASLPPPQLAVDRHALARNRGVADLRRELARRLAVVHEGGGRNLQEATRVMRLLGQLETKAFLETETKARSGLGSLETLLRQKASQAEQVQSDKHDKLLRTLECAKAKAGRMLTARHRGALGRLVEVRRDEDRRKKKQLCATLALAKGKVARVWREHNQILLGGTSQSTPQMLPTAPLLSALASTSARETPSVRSILSVENEEGPVEQRGDGVYVTGELKNRPWKVVAAAATAAAAVTAVSVVPSGEASMPSIVSDEDRGDGVGTDEERNNGRCNVSESTIGQPHGTDNHPPVDCECDNGNVADAGNGDGGGDFFSCDVSVSEIVEATADEESSTSRCEQETDEGICCVNVRAAQPTEDSRPLRPNGVKLREKCGGEIGSVNRTDFTCASHDSVRIHDDGQHTPATRREGNGIPLPKPKRRLKKRTGPATAISAERRRKQLPMTNTRSMDILSEEEAEALATLGRGAPNEIANLLTPSNTGTKGKPLPPEVPFSCRTTDFELRLDGGSGWGMGVGRHERGGEEVWDNLVVQRAVDKLVSKMRADEESTRQRLGMVSLFGGGSRRGGGPEQGGHG